MLVASLLTQTLPSPTAGNTAPATFSCLDERLFPLGELWKTPRWRDFKECEHHVESLEYVVGSDGGGTKSPQRRRLSASSRMFGAWSKWYSLCMIDNRSRISALSSRRSGGKLTSTLKRLYNEGLHATYSGSVRTPATRAHRGSGKAA